MTPPSNPRKLRIQFRKRLRYGQVNNMVMDPLTSGGIEGTAEPDESFIAKVDQTHGGCYWFSDRRVQQEDGSGVVELLRYDAVTKVRWRFKWRDSAGPFWMGLIPKMTRDHDGLEVETQDGLAVLENLGEAFSPTVQFFKWITRARSNKQL